MRPNSLAFRLVAGAALWIAAALLAGGFALSAIFKDYVERAYDARLLVLLDALVAASDVVSENYIEVSRDLGDPRFEQPYSGWYWQITSPRGPLVRSRSLWDQALRPGAGLVGMGGRVTPSQLTAPRQPLRIVGRDVTLPGVKESLHYMVTGDTTETETEIRNYNTTLAWSLGALGLGLVIAVFIQVRFGLLPLRTIGQSLYSIRSGKTTHLEGRFPAEIEPLADEINGLLDHNTEVLERARTHVGNLAHALKTPLAVLANATVADKSALGETVAKQTEAMRRHVEHYLAKARTAAAAGILGQRTEVLPVIEDLRRTLKRIHAERAIELEIKGDPALCFRGERHDLEEMLGNLIDNACKWAKNRVWITLADEGPKLSITIEDDGPGLAPEQRAEVFARGHRLDEAKPGSGLGLAIVTDSAGLYGGDVELKDSDLGGLAVVLTLPAALADKTED